MKNNLIKIQKNMLRGTILFGIVAILLFPTLKIHITKQNSFNNFQTIFGNNLLVCTQLIIPFYNSVVLLIQIIYNFYIIKITLLNNVTLIVRLLPHVVFEFISVILSLMLSFDVLKMLLRQKLNWEKIRTKITLIILLLLIGSIVEYYISGRL